MKRVVVDPITRIEGHLRVEAMLNDSGVIENAMSSGTMWRGIEVILQGRDPRDAWAFCERICGVCTTVHALASVRAVENALVIKIPQNAALIRNIMFLTQMVQDHVIHFYHLHALDWVDIVSALKANPKATAELAQTVSPSWPTSTPGYFSDVQGTIKKFVESGQLGIFQNAYWGHPAYKLPPEAADGETHVDQNVIANLGFGHPVEVSLARDAAELNAANAIVSDFLGVEDFTRHSKTHGALLKNISKKSWVISAPCRSRLGYGPLPPRHGSVRL
jgi:Ni,Fe-hydrogenase I large subunit